MELWSWERTGSPCSNLPLTESLATRLATAGIETSFVDGFGQQRQVREQTLQRILDLQPNPHPADTVAEPRCCYVPDQLREPQRLWGLVVQVYALRSSRNWGIGDFTDLTRLGVMAADLGASFIAVNPLHARSLAEPELCSPYSPTSRHFIDPLYIDPCEVDDYRANAALSHAIRIDTEKERKALCESELIEYERSSRFKCETLLRLFRHFVEHEHKRDSARARNFDAFVRSRGDSLQHYAEFEAQRMVQASTAELEELKQFHCYLQWIADQQLAQSSEALRKAGMPIGLYLDLAVGPALAGAEAQDPSCAMIDKVSAGAPPDAFNPQGQFWNLAVFDPSRLSQTRAQPFADLLRANMRYAGALRLDHVMGLQRLFWALPGSGEIDGAYVNYPFDLLSQVLAEISQEHECLVVGEDLGTVPQGFREKLRDRQIFGCKVLWFEQETQTSFKDPQSFPWGSLISAATHDTPTILGYWTGRDLEIRRELGLFADDLSVEAAHAERRAARLALARLLEMGSPLADNIASGTPPPLLCGAIHKRLARSPSALLQIQLDDVLECIDPINVPGTTGDQYPNWRRKYPVALEQMAADSRIGELQNLSRLRICTPDTLHS